MRIVALLLIPALIAGCRGNRVPPAEGTSGVMISSADPQQLAVDPSAVPIAGDCPIDSLVVRTASGWSCGTPETAIAAQLARIQSELADRLTTLETVAADIEARRAELMMLESLAEELLRAFDDRAIAQRATVSAYAALACVPNEIRFGAPSYEASSSTGSVQSVAPLALWCPVAAKAATLLFNEIDLSARDPDGVGTSASVSSTLLAIDPVGPIAVGSIDSAAATAPDLLASGPLVMAGDAARPYVQRVELSHTAGPAPGVLGATVMLRPSHALRRHSIAKQIGSDR